MFIIIGGDGKEYGPVSAEQVRAWIASGRANLQTKAKPAGSAEWHTLADYPEFAGDPSAPPPPLPTAAPASSAPPSDPKAYADDLIARAAPLDVFGSIERAFKLWTGNFFPLVGVTLLIVLAQWVAGIIPLVGILSSFLLNGVFAGGLYYYYLGKLRGEPRTVGDGFAGFSLAFVPLMLATLLTTVITLAVMLVCCAPLIGFVLKVLMAGAAHQQADTLPAFSPIALVGILIGGVAVIYLGVSWIFTFPLVIDQQLGPWTAMEVSRRVVGKQWFRVFFTLLLGGILTLLGLIGLFIGIFFTLPLAVGAVICAYESLCRPPRS